MTRRKPSPLKPNAIRPLYEEHGADGYYARFGDHYRNPHEPIIAALVQALIHDHALSTAHVLDLACGSGEVTLALRTIGVAQITGVDPYTGEAYLARTGTPALPFTFEQIAEGALAHEVYSLVVCSFALHLCAPSWLPKVCYALAQIAPCLLILTPHKRPILEPSWGWTLHEERLLQRVRGRVYFSSHVNRE